MLLLPEPGLVRESLAKLAGTWLCPISIASDSDAGIFEESDVVAACDCDAVAVESDVVAACDCDAVVVESDVVAACDCDAVAVEEVDVFASEPLKLAKACACAVAKDC